MICFKSPSNSLGNGNLIVDSLSQSQTFYLMLEFNSMSSSYKILDKAINIIAPGNRFTQSKVVEDSIKDVLINKYGSNWKEQNDLFFNSYEFLRKDFRKESYCGDVSYFYLMYYMPLNIPKVQLVFLQLMKKKNLPRELNILDIGSGVGTTAVAILDLIALLDNLCELYGTGSFFDRVNISAVEGSGDNINVFKENLSFFKERLNKISSIEKVTLNPPVLANIEKSDIQGNYDLVILSNVISEIKFYPDRKNLIIKLSGNLKKSGGLMIIEPASRSRAESMNRLKYEICDTTNLKSIAPCGTCEKCRQCWIYQTCDIANSELISYVDRLYEVKHTSKYEDTFYNDRLKWAYCILSYDYKEKVCSDLSTLPNNVPTKVKVHIVGNRRNNAYAVCDGKGNKGRLVGKDVELSFFKFGDFIDAENVTVSRLRDTFRISFLSDSQVFKHYSNPRTSKTIFPEINAESLVYLLNRLWGFNTFRDGQIELIKGALNGNDILGILPTGAGKSVCYQLPAILGNGVSLVVSPLKSLIKDQITNLKNVGFEFVDYIDGSKTPDEKAKTLSRFKAGSLKLLYLTPERLQMRNFQLELFEVLKNHSIDYFIIDEAHCASEWGHDFRPSYLKLIDVAKAFKTSRIIAVTATASPKVKEDILNIFHIKKKNVITSHSLDRDEISFQVINLPIEASKDEYLKKALLQDIPRTLQEIDINDINRFGSGIIFTIYASPRGVNTYPFGTDYILDRVREMGIEANLYHSQLKDNEREKIQDQYKQDMFPLLVSTKGFGMGIDKPNIRYIVHMCYTNSLEAYYQEAGRAGRDRQHAHSIIISRSRTQECVKHTNNIAEFEPKCIGKWKCYYTDAVICDYGMQARFISNNYSDAQTTQKELKQFYHNLVQASGGQNEFHITKYSNTNKYEKYLFYFQMHGVIKNYYISSYMGKNGVKFGIEVNPDKFNMTNIGNVIVKIVNRLENFKKQKYNMLESIWQYVDNKSRCRRQFLLDYFQDKASIGEEGCKFCDIEGISEEKAILANRSLKIDKLYSEFQKLMELNDFDYPQVKSLLNEIYEECEHEGITVRAMKHLEDYTDNLVALYFRTIITLKRDQADAYARNQANDLIALLLKKRKIDTCAYIINDFIDIDEKLAILFLLSNENLIADSRVADSLINDLKTEATKECVYKMFFDNRIVNLNNTLIRSIQNGFVED